MMFGRSRRDVERRLAAAFEERYGRLATFNAEVARGIVHRPEYVAKMAVLQEAYDEEMRGGVSTPFVPIKSRSLLRPF